MNENKCWRQYNHFFLMNFSLTELGMERSTSRTLLISISMTLSLFLSKSYLILLISYWVYLSSATSNYLSSFYRYKKWDYSFFHSLEFGFFVLSVLADLWVGSFLGLLQFTGSALVKGDLITEWTFEGSWMRNGVPFFLCVLNDVVSFFLSFEKFVDVCCFTHLDVNIFWNRL